MAIVTYDYYTNVYFGEAVAECQFAQYLAKATQAVNLMTHGRASHYDVLPAVLQTAVQNAICAQISYYIANGLEISVNGNSAGGWTVGKVRVDKGGSSTATGARSMLCAAAYAELEQTGLLNPNVPVVGMPPYRPWLGVW